MAGTLFAAGFLMLVPFAATLYMSADGADDVLRSGRRIGGIGVLCCVVLMCVGALLGMR